MRYAVHILAAAGLIGLASAGAEAATIYANNAAPGDSFTNPGGSNQGQAVGATGWVYNNVRGGGTVGINDSLPRSGTGSVSFSSPSGAGKADIEFLGSPTLFMGNYFATTSLGAFSDFTGMSYEWFRSSASTNPATQMPSLRILLDRDGNLNTTNDRGGLVFERVYNGGVVPVDGWTLDTIAGNTFLWNFGLGGSEMNINATPYAYDATLDEWKAYLGDAVILGFSSGIGSGWNGNFVGAVDNISWTIAGQETTTNFEVRGGTPIPEPASLAVLGLGLMGLAGLRRAKRA